MFRLRPHSSLNKPLTLELVRCEYVVAPDNIIALGNSGAGKTQLMEARDERRLLKLQAQLAAVNLLIRTARH